MSIEKPVLAISIVALTLTAGSFWSPLQARETERITSTANMNLQRAGHSATLLTDGTVLIVGGCVVDGCETRITETAELFNPLTNSFSETGFMALPRVGHAAVRLPSNKVLIVGGWVGRGATATAELYDPTTQTFSTTGKLNEARDGFTATRLNDGRVLVAGGYRGGMERLSSAELYDPKTGRFTDVGPMSSARMSHSASLLPDGRVLIVGGTRARGDVLSSAEIFDPRTTTFKTVASLITPRHKQAAVVLKDGRVLVLGGSNANDFGGQFSSAETFDLKSGKFTSAKSMNAARFKISDAVTRLDNDQVFIGGSDRQAEVFDPITNSYRIVPGDLDTERSYSTVTLLPGGQVLIAGGYDGNIRVSNHAWLYMP